jgi:hypothetical protein
MTDKESALHVIRGLPDDTTLEEIQEEIAILIALGRAQADVVAGRFVPHDIVKRRIAEWPATLLPIARVPLHPLQKRRQQPVKLRRPFQGRHVPCPFDHVELRSGNRPGDLAHLLRRRDPIFASDDH